MLEQLKRGEVCLAMVRKKEAHKYVLSETEDFVSSVLKKTEKNRYSVEHVFAPEATEAELKKKVSSTAFKNLKRLGSNGYDIAVDGVQQVMRKYFYSRSSSTAMYCLLQHTKRNVNGKQARTLVFKGDSVKGNCRVEHKAIDYLEKVFRGEDYGEITMFLTHAPCEKVCCDRIKGFLQLHPNVNLYICFTLYHVFSTPGMWKIIKGCPSQPIKFVGFRPSQFRMHYTYEGRLLNKYIELIKRN